MSDLKLIKETFTEDLFPEIKHELSKSYNYEGFISDISKHGLRSYSVLNHLKDTVEYMRLIKQSEILDEKKQRSSFLTVLKITLFVSLVEAYSNEDKYMSIESYLKRSLNPTDPITKKMLFKHISNYQMNYSLSACIYDFILKGNKIDKIWLSSCIEPEHDFKINRPKLELLQKYIRKQETLKIKLKSNRLEGKLLVLGLAIISNDPKHSKDPEVLKTIDELDIKFNNEYLEKRIFDISKKLYDIRSKFLHTGNKSFFDTYVDTQRGNFLDFIDFNFFRFFIRTVLTDLNFRLNIYDIPSNFNIYDDVND